jgi:HEAT repeat protein
MDDREKILKEDKIVVEALKEVGTFVTSSQDLVNTRERYPKAIPVLLKMLSTVRTYTIKGIIARSLGVREAKGRAEPLLISEFELSLDDPSDVADDFRWKLANTLEILGGGRGTSESLLRLLADPRSGHARGMLSIAVAKTKDRRAIPVLTSLLDNVDFAGFAAKGLGLLKAEEAIPNLWVIARQDPNLWTRRQAANALKRMGVKI